jgi:hypothetical protein
MAESLKLQGAEIEFARLALTILEEKYLEVLKRTGIVDHLIASTSREDILAALVASFDAADLLAREQLGVPLKAETPPGLRTQ